MIPRYFATWQPAPNHGPPQLNDTSRSGLENLEPMGVLQALTSLKTVFFKSKTRVSWVQGKGCCVGIFRLYNQRKWSQRWPQTGEWSNLECMNETQKGLEKSTKQIIHVSSKTSQGVKFSKRKGHTFTDIKFKGHTGKSSPIASSS